MGSTSLIFWLCMTTLTAGLVYGFYQFRKTDESQEVHGDDKRALTHKLQREQEAVEAERGTGNA